MNQPTNTVPTIIRCKHCHAVIATRTEHTIIIGILIFAQVVKAHCVHCGCCNRLDPTTPMGPPQHDLTGAVLDR